MELTCSIIIRTHLTDYFMINLHSPQFSSSHKIDIAAHLSPSFRNKRVPSVQEIYSSSHWNRVNSFKKLDSPSKLSEKRKRSQNSQQKSKAKNNQSMQNIATQMNFLRDQYKTLKEAYHNLIQQKLKNTEEAQMIKEESFKLKEENEKMGKEAEKLKSKIGFLEMELERIKKQSLKLIQIQQFKVKKLEENLTDKDKIIEKMMSSLKIDNPNVSLPTQSNEDSYTFQAKQPTHNGFLIDESLTLSQDKTLSNQSHSQFISISLTSMMENQSVYRHQLSTKRTNFNHNLQNSMTEAENIDDIEITQKPMGNITRKINNAINMANANNSKNSDNNFKKLRKEIGKRIEVNIDEKHKEFVTNSHQPRTPLDRKASKSTKASKTRLKRNEEENLGESFQNKSSKKRSGNK